MQHQGANVTDVQWVDQGLGGKRQKGRHRPDTEPKRDFAPDAREVGKGHKCEN